MYVQYIYSRGVCCQCYARFLSILVCCNLCCCPGSGAATSPEIPCQHRVSGGTSLKVEASQAECVMCWRHQARKSMHNHSEEPGDIWWFSWLVEVTQANPQISPDNLKLVCKKCLKCDEVWKMSGESIYEPQVWTSSWSFFCGRAVLLARLACFCRLFGAKPLLSLYVVTGSHRWAETEKTRTASVNGWLRPVIFVCLWAK